MLDTKMYVLFVISGLALNLTPGPDMLFILACGTRGGRRAGAWAALGAGVGGVIHTLAAALGLSAVLVSSAAAFATVKYLGAAYLVYLGLRAFLGAAPSGASAQAAPPSERVFFRAVTTCLFNPKVALFFLAFVPQFVDSRRGHLPLQFLVLGLTFCTTGTLVNTTVGVAVGSFRAVLSRPSRAKAALDKVTGAIFVSLGIKLALADHR